MSPNPALGGDARVQLLDDIVNSDLSATRREYWFRTPYVIDKLAPMMKDPRDEPLVCLQLNIVAVVIPCVCALYGLNMYLDLSFLARTLIGLSYVVTLYGLFLERFILMLHFSSHRKVYNNDFLNGVVIWLFCPFFGIPCGLYKLHHVVMHHIENNHVADTSSTENYRRDSWLEFLRYWAHFCLGVYVELPTYTIKSKRYSWFASVMGGLAVWVFSIAFLARYLSVTATVWAFVVTHVISMSAMAFGNWSQHIFVDPTNPDSNFGLTYNCMDVPGNQTTFNDGYHIIHHLQARLHWTELPQYFHDNRQKHHDGGALTFRGVHFFDVGIYVMTKRLRALAELYVHLGPRETAPTVGEVEAKLRRWLEPVAPRAKKPSATKAE